jgi:hypothetical protein
MPKDFAPWEDPQYGQGKGSKEVAPWEQDSKEASGTGEKKTAMEELQDLSLPRQALSGAVGGFQALGSMASTIPAMAAGGLRGAGSLIMGEGPEEAARKSAETTDKYTYEPGTAAGRVFTGLAGEGFEALKEGAGDYLVNQMEGNSGPARRAQPRRPMDPKDEALTRSVGEFGFEAPMAAGPVLGLKPSRGAKVTPELPKAPKEVAPWNAR